MTSPLSRRPLRDKLLLVFLAPTLLIVSGFGVLAYYTAFSELEEELGKRLTSIGQTLAAQISGGIEASQIARLDPSKVRTIRRLESRLEAVQRGTDSKRLFLISPALTSLVDTQQGVEFGQKLFDLEADRFEIESALATATPHTSVLFRGDDGARYKTAYVPILEPQEEEPSSDPKVVAILGVVASASFFELLTGFASGLTLIGLGSLALVVVIGVAFARRLTRPLNTLVEAARRLEKGDFESPIKTQADTAAQGEVGGDEIASLGVSFEAMRLGILSRDKQMQMMLSGIAHEVRNPLGGIELFCGLLHEDMSQAGNEDAAGKVERIQRELVYLNKVVNDFLAFAKHRPLEVERFGAGDLATDLEALLWGEAHEAGCPLKFEVEPPQMELTADRERLRRALINTIRNAIQASPSGGQVCVRMKATPQGSCLEVEDQGMGIPRERLAEILTPFFTTKEKGSGLGLALTGRIIEQHGGTLEIQSELGEGTLVRFVIPWDDKVQPQQMVPNYGEVPEGWLG